ncbi:MAG: 3'(2'),5'-bisphosphate nucleotidase CysQ family protein [Nanobdellota archaeon]
MVNYKSELNAAIDAAKESGSKVMKVYYSDYKVETKEDDSPLTKADRLSNEILTKRLSKFDYGIVSEEAENIDTNNAIQWIIDPLDGTSDFIQKTGEFSVMIALVVKSEPVLGVVYAPAVDKLWYATKGDGAYLLSENRTKKINVSQTQNLSDYRLVISRNHFRQNDKDVADRLGITNFRKMGSVGVKFASIAEGEAELCVYTTDKMGVWDDCASHVILKEAGGDVFDIEGNEPVYDLTSRKMDKGFIGTNGMNKGEIINSVKKGLE